MDDAFTLNCRPMVPVMGCEEQVNTASQHCKVYQSLPPSNEGADTQTNPTFGENVLRSQVRFNYVLSMCNRFIGHTQLRYH